mmetsp:Transcript_8791/g.19321  ORF Transcript_8791/g.19321 Transcript_8791/m.19321 type:complete len:717 (+) Transcript_8791:68-2218(+)
MAGSPGKKLMMWPPQADSPPPHLVNQVRQEMMRLMTANAQVLATTCAESCVHQVWSSFFECLVAQKELELPAVPVTEHVASVLSPGVEELKQELKLALPAGPGAEPVALGASTAVKELAQPADPGQPAAPISEPVTSGASPSTEEFKLPAEPLPEHTASVASPGVEEPKQPAEPVVDPVASIASPSAEELKLPAEPAREHLASDASHAVEEEPAPTAEPLSVPVVSVIPPDAGAVRPPAPVESPHVEGCAATGPVAPLHPLSRASAADEGQRQAQVIARSAALPEPHGAGAAVGTPVKEAAAAEGPAATPATVPVSQSPQPQPAQSPEAETPEIVRGYRGLFEAAIGVLEASSPAPRRGSNTLMPPQPPYIAPIVEASATSSDGDTASQKDFRERQPVVPAPAAHAVEMNYGVQQSRRRLYKQVSPGGTSLMFSETYGAPEPAGQKLPSHNVSKTSIESDSPGEAGMSRMRSGPAAILREEPQEVELQELKPRRLSDKLEYAGGGSSGDLEELRMRKTKTSSTVINAELEALQEVYAQMAEQLALLEEQAKRAAAAAAVVEEEDSDDSADDAGVASEGANGRRSRRPSASFDFMVQRYVHRVAQRGALAGSLNDEEAPTSDRAAAHAAAAGELSPSSASTDRRGWGRRHTAPAAMTDLSEELAQEFASSQAWLTGAVESAIALMDRRDHFRRLSVQHDIQVLCANESKSRHRRSVS